MREYPPTPLFKLYTLPTTNTSYDNLSHVFTSPGMILACYRPFGRWSDHLYLIDTYGLRRTGPTNRGRQPTPIPQPLVVPATSYTILCCTFVPVRGVAWGQFTVPRLRMRVRLSAPNARAMLPAPVPKRMAFCDMARKVAQASVDPGRWNLARRRGVFIENSPNCTVQPPCSQCVRCSGHSPYNL